MGNSILGDVRNVIPALAEITAVADYLSRLRGPVRDRAKLRDDGKLRD